jgi:peroxiredoxin
MTAIARLASLGLSSLIVAVSFGSAPGADDPKPDAPKQVVSRLPKKAAAKVDPLVLVGKPAPEIPGAGQFAVNGSPVSLSDLKGKVVLVDFWAVWCCGPCVATFPNLRDWNAEFKDKGLAIVGVTGYCSSYDFDKEAGQVKIAPKPLSTAEEQEMLKKFADHHKLEYLLMAMPKPQIDAVYDAYKVTGIPEAVLIDRKGVVRMVKLGVGPANAKAIADEIKKLIDEKP